MDREKGGVEMLASKGIKLHPIISMSQLLRVLQAAERIDAQTAQSVHKFIRDNNTFSPKNGSDSPASKKQLSYSERAELANIYLLASKLLKIMEEKQSNLCVSADVTNSEELLQLAESLGPKICMLKTHVDILEVQMAEEHSDSVMGFICGSKLTERPEFIHMTPGVQMQAGGGPRPVQVIITESGSQPDSLFSGSSPSTSLNGELIGQLSHSPRREVALPSKLLRHLWYEF